MSIKIRCEECGTAYQEGGVPIDLCCECDKLHCASCASWYTLLKKVARPQRFVCHRCFPSVEERFVEAEQQTSSPQQTMKGLLEKLLPKEETPEEKREREREERELRIRGAKRIWEEDIIPVWQRKRDSNKVKRLCWLGVPPALRQTVWPLLIGNKMGVTAELFHIHGQRAYEARSVKRDETLRTGSQMSKEDTVNLIPVDIGRTYPKLGFFQEEGPQHEELRLVLEAYVCLRPDVGYVQGMSFLAAMLLLNMPIEETFQCLANMLNQKVLTEFYRMNIVNVKKYVLILEELLGKYAPAVLANLERHRIELTMYLVDWILTLFAKSLPLDIAGRIWDNYLAHGVVFIFRVAVAIFRLGEPVLRAGEFEDCLYYLGHLEDLSEADLFEAIRSVNISQRVMRDMLAKYNLE